MPDDMSEQNMDGSIANSPLSADYNKNSLPAANYDRNSSPDGSLKYNSPSANQDVARFHRHAAVLRTLGTIDVETDIRVRLLCRVVDKTVTGVIVEDFPTLPAGSVAVPQLEVMLEQDVLASLNQGDVVRVFARVLPLESGFELRGEIVQDMNILDAELYKKVFGGGKE